jgi:hypothetical protein
MPYMTLMYTPPGSQGGHEKSEEGNLRDELPNKVIISLLDLKIPSLTFHAGSSVKSEI